MCEAAVSAKGARAWDLGRTPRMSAHHVCIRVVHQCDKYYRCDCVLCRAGASLSLIQQMIATAGILAGAGGPVGVSLIGLHDMDKQGSHIALDNSSGLYTQTAAVFSQLLLVAEPDCLRTLLTGAAAVPLAPCLASALSQAPSQALSQCCNVAWQWAANKPAETRHWSNILQRQTGPPGRHRSNAVARCQSGIPPENRLGCSVPRRGRHPHPSRQHAPALPVRSSDNQID